MGWGGFAQVARGPEKVACNFHNTHYDRISLGFVVNGEQQSNSDGWMDE